MIIDRSLDPDDYQEFIGTWVKDQNYVNIGKISGFGLSKEHRYGRSEVFAVFEDGRKMLVSGIPELDGVVTYDKEK